MAGLWGVPWVVWAIVCLVIGAINTVLWPRPKNSSGRGYSAWQYVVLRWFHGLVWVLLAISCLIRLMAAPGGDATANTIGLLALVVYLIFLGTMVSTSAARR